MRYARGKSTHQRVEGESTSWQDLKSTPAKSKNFKNKRFADKKSFSGGKGKGRFNRREEEISSNFTPLGERPTSSENGSSESQDKNSKGYGKTKLVKIFGQFWVSPEDAKRLQGLQKKLQDQGLSRKEILDALQNERRRAEKAGKRQRDKTCFNCRQFGHVLYDCPTKGDNQEDPSNLVDFGRAGEICFKCGSTEHTSRKCKRKEDKFSFAKCFICSKSGHIARQCPDNSKGIYPGGGSCGDCGSVNHLRKDCPSNLSGDVDMTDNSAIAPRLSNPFTSTEYEAENIDSSLAAPTPKKKKVDCEEINEDDVPPPQSVNPKGKTRKVKF